MKTIAKLLLLVLIALCFTAGASAATFVVNTTSDTHDITPGNGACNDIVDMCSFRAALMEANALAGADIITLPAGVYTQTIVSADEDNNAGGDWDIRSSITINGAGAANTFLQADAAANTATERVLHSVLSANVVVINGVTIRNGKKTAPVTNDNSRGGGISNAGTLTINNSAVTANRTNGGGAGIQNFGDIALNNVTVSGNRCDSLSVECYGGGMLSFFESTGNVTISDSTFDGNYVKAKDPNLSLGNGHGGGMGIQTTNSAGVNLNITNSRFINNTGEGFGTDPGLGGGRGGGIYVNIKGPSVINITGSVISGNRVIQGFVEMGGGIYVESSGSLTGTWNKMTVSDNNAALWGNGIYLSSKTTGQAAVDIVNSTISNNIPNFQQGTGGGIVVRSEDSSDLSVNFYNTTISGNRNRVAGGVFIGSTPSARVIANFNFCTIVNNGVESAQNFGAGINASTGPDGAVNLKNTIVARNIVSGSGAGAEDISNGRFLSQGYNHIENASAGFIPAASDMMGADPLLGPLADNGGPTLTHRPLAGSVVVNAIPNGVNGCGTTFTTDQRGLPRPNDGAACDKGSVELNSGPYDLSGTVRTSGGMPIRNAVVVLEGGSLPQPIFYLTNNFGLYLFPDLAPGQYTVSISSKRYTFLPKPLNLQQDELTLDFTAQPESRMSFEILPKAAQRK